MHNILARLQKAFRSYVIFFSFIFSLPLFAEHLYRVSEKNVRNRCGIITQGCMSYGHRVSKDSQQLSTRCGVYDKRYVLLPDIPKLINYRRLTDNLQS